MAKTSKNTIRILIASLISVSAWTAWAQENEDTIGELHGRHGRSICIYFLDGYLCLSPEQSTALDEALKQNWSNDRNNNLAYFIYNGYSLGKTHFDSIEEENLAEILNDVQKMRFDNLATDSLSLTNLLNFRSESLREDGDPISPNLKAVSELEINRLTELLELSEQQKQRLVIGAKGASQAIINQRIALFEDAGNDVNKLIVKTNSLKILMEPPLYQLTKTKIWEKSVKQALTEKQWETYQTDRLSRHRRSVKAAAFSVVKSYQNSENEFDLAEYQGMVQLLEKMVASKIESGTWKRESSAYFETFDVFKELEEENFTSILTGEKLTHVITALKAARERTEKANAEAGQDDETDLDQR
ncbi:hypothetical protein OAG68_02250 [bacterium]|nr:hypothetical protein [bacterium]